MAYIEVDVDLDEFDTWELVQELCARLKNNHRKPPSEKEMKKLFDDLKDLIKVLNVPLSDEVQIESLADKMKYEYISLIFRKYTLDQIQNALPE